MRLSEFVRQPNEYGLHCDSYVHPESVSTPLGKFSVQLAIVASGAKKRPCLRMLEAARSLRSAFIDEIDAIVDLTYQQYLKACYAPKPVLEDPHFPWQDIPKGRSRLELNDLLDSPTIIVNEHEVDEEEFPGRIFMSPLWDQRNCLFFARVSNIWKHVLI